MPYSAIICQVQYLKNTECNMYDCCSAVSVSFKNGQHFDVEGSTGSHLSFLMRYASRIYHPRLKKIDGNASCGPQSARPG